MESTIQSVVITIRRMHISFDAVLILALIMTGLVGFVFFALGMVNASTAVLLPALVPVSPDGTNAGVTCVSTCWNRIDESPAAPDGVVIYGDGEKKANSIGDYVFLNISDMPVDFTVMDTLSAEVSLSLQQQRHDDNAYLYIQIYDAAESVPLTDEQLVATGASLDWLVNTTTSVMFASVLPGNKAMWDGARARLRWTYEQTKAPDGAYIQLDALELGGTYIQ